MSDAEITRRIMYCLLCALMIITFTAIWLGEQRKAMWFKKRENWNIFTKRGWLGERLNFGRPVTKEGYMVTAAMAAAIAIVSAIIFVV